MHPQLELLLELQDLHSQRRALREEPLREMEAKVFDLEPSEALIILDTKLEELVERLEPGVRSRYSSIARSLDRAVVPVLNGVCYGCFVATPTSWTSDATRNDNISVCDHCGRFLYYID
jgi:predicted  nucleic acid-binding Zn-ribbon protein